MSLPSSMYMRSSSGEIRKCFINCGWFGTAQSISSEIYEEYAAYKQRPEFKDDGFYADEFVAYGCYIAFDDLKQGKDHAAQVLREATPEELERFGLKPEGQN